MSDTIPINHIESIVNNLNTLRLVNEANVSFMEQSKEILAVQWLLGNIGIIALFVIAIIAYKFSGKALKAFAPGYRLPKRWLLTLIVSFGITLVVFNIIPQLIPVNTGLTEKTEKELSRTSDKAWYAEKK